VERPSNWTKGPRADGAVPHFGERAIDLKDNRYFPGADAHCADTTSTWEIVMTKRHYWIGILALSSLVVLGAALFRPSGAQAQGQYPIMDQIANKIINKYQTSNCEQLWEQKSQHTPPSMEEQRAIGILKNDPQMRAAFINKIAPPIANKMFDCGMIP
jgi:hypothetical protein